MVWTVTWTEVKRVKKSKAKKKVSCSLESALILQAIGFKIDVAELLAEISAIFLGEGGTYHDLFLDFQSLLS